MTTQRSDLRRLLAREVGPAGVFHASSDGTTTQVICTDAFKSTELPASHLAYAWAYFPNATPPNLRRVKGLGLDPLNGTIALDGALGSAPLTNAVFELTTLLPATREYGATSGQTMTLGLNEIINIALRHILITDVLSLTLESGERDYSLSAWAFLDRAERLREIRVPNVLETGTEPITSGWTLRENMQGYTLHFDRPFRFRGGPYTIELEAARPGDTSVLRSGSWTEVVGGLAADADATALDPNSVIDVALALCYRTLRDKSHGPAFDEYDALYVRQLAVARGTRNYDRANDLDRTVPQAAAAAPVGAAA